MLSLKGYKIDMASLSHYTYSIPEMNSQYQENNFLIEYWTAKADYINRLYRSDKFNSITIIDDDEIICAILRKFKFTVIQAEIQQIGIDLHIRFHPFHQKFNHQLLEDEVMAHG